MDDLGVPLVLEKPIYVLLKREGLVYFSTAICWAMLSPKTGINIFIHNFAGEGTKNIHRGQFM